MVEVTDRLTCHGHRLRVVAQYQPYYNVYLYVFEKVFARIATLRWFTQLGIEL
jgi:hypothetical protein